MMLFSAGPLYSLKKMVSLQQFILLTIRAEKGRNP